MKKNKLILIFLFLFGIGLLLSGCDTEEAVVDYDLILENSLDQVKIAGVATTANRDFTVPLELKVTYEEKEYTITLSWVSSDPDVISLDGSEASVIRPDEGDSEVDLTCTLALGGKVKEKIFKLTVYEKELTTADILDEAELELKDLVDKMNTKNITQKLSLPNVAGLASVSWTSDNISTITSTGDITRPNYGDGNASVKMTATLASGADKRNVEFTFVVLEKERPADSEIPALAADYLVIKTEDVISNLDLSLTGRFETEISWETTNPDIISDTGVVSRPNASTGGYVLVSLTATITYKEYSHQKEFLVKVLELEPKDDQEKAEVAFHNLDLNYIIVSEENLELPLSSTYDTNFIYTAEDSNISIDGGIIGLTRLTYDYIARIKATTKINDQSYEFIFSFVVKSTKKGSGTISDPFVIESAEDLERLGTGEQGWTLDSHYVLYKDIDLSTVCSEEVGSWTPIGSRDTPFTGTFNGNGYTISNLYVKAVDREGVGLFGGVYKATIKNLYLKDSYVEGSSRVATLAGYVASSVVQNVFVERTNVIALTALDCQSGGLIGFAEVKLPEEESLLVENCSVIDGVVTGQYHVGGLIGRVTNNIIDDNDTAYHVVIRNVYVGVTVYANRRQGGLIGSFTGKLENAIVDAVLKAHPNPSNTQNISALCIGAIEYKGGQAPMTSISNVVFSGDMQDIIDLATGRTATLFAFKSVTEDYIILENVYMTCEPYQKNGSGDYNEGANGVQITMENATSNLWYANNLKSFDLEKVWKMTDGMLPVLQYQNDNSLYEAAMEVYLNIPTEVSEDLNLITETYLNKIVISWESDNEAIAIDGKITRPAYVDGDEIVKLIARYAINGKDYQREFVLTLKAWEPTEEEMFETVKGEIDLNLDLEEVVDDLNLLTLGSFGAEISWESDNEAITADGVVSRPEAGASDAIVKLVAEVKINGVTKEYEYTLVVKAWPNTEKALNDVYDTLVFPEVVTEDLVFAEAIISNGLEVSISWQSNNTAISNTGQVIRPNYLQGDAIVNIVASLSCGDFSMDKEFVIRVNALDATDQEMVIEAVNLINNVLVTEMDASILLPELKENVLLTYEIIAGSDYLSFLEQSIIVLRPSYEVGDIDYSFKISITYNTASDVITKTGKVLKSMGDGSQAAPFIIDSLELLENIGSGNFKLNSHYILKRDIDLGTKYNSTSNLSWTPITNFNGSFDGDNHSISNLYINGTGNHQGLFGRLTNGVIIRNLKVVDANITAKQNVGILAGQINTNSDALIENISVTGSVIAINGTGDTVNGGLIGAVDSRVDAGKSANVIIRNCKIDVDVVGCQNVGGLAGNVKANKGTNSIIISDIEIKGTVKGNQKLGGAFGQIERNSAGTQTGTETYIKIQNIVTYATISFNHDNDKNPSGCGGFVGQLSDSTTDVTVDFVNCIVYNPYDSASFASVPSVGWYASFGGRSPKEAGVSLTDAYINGEPFGYNGSNPKDLGNLLGTKLEESNLLSLSWYLEELNFSADIWKLGENGIELI